MLSKTLLMVVVVVALTAGLILAAGWAPRDRPAPARPRRTPGERRVSGE